jgi:hypothetical protein
MNAVTVPEPARDPFFALVERAATDPAFDPDKIDKLLIMWERTKSQAAEAEFNTAMAVAQSEMDPVRKDSDNPQTRSRYASYAAMDRAVRPTYTAHGFCLSFNTEDIPTADEVRVVCYVSRAGFTRRYQVEMPTDGKGLKGGDVMTRTHAMGSGITYGRRYLLAMIFNLATTDKDDDGNAAGGKTYMGAPYPRQAAPMDDETKAKVAAGRQAQAAEAERGAAANAADPPQNPHTLPTIEGEKLSDWTLRYIKALEACTSAADLAGLKDGNQTYLTMVVNHTSPNAQPFQDRLRKATAAAGARLAGEGGRPLAGETTLPASHAASAGSLSPSSTPTSTAAASGGTSGATKPAVTITNPEAFIKESIKRLNQCETVQALDAIWARDVEPFEAQLFPSDLRAIAEHYEVRLTALEGKAGPSPPAA